jgi:saccharopine dehydrogenase-like NADP-dependent oxidoreductase
VFGAYGHTGRFVVGELRRRGWTPVPSGRDSERLRAAAQEHPLAEVRVAAVDDSASLEAARAGSGVVINCAGPFIDTSLPIVDVAIRSGVHYLDVAAERAKLFGLNRGQVGNVRSNVPAPPPAWSRACAVCCGRPGRSKFNRLNDAQDHPRSC